MGAAPDPVAVPGHAVPAVPVVAEAEGAERLAELVRVVPAQRRPGLSEHRVRRFGVGRVRGEQTGDVHHPLVHLPAFRPPGDGPGQLFEQLVRAVQPPRQQVQPGAVAEHLSSQAGEQAEAGAVAVGVVEQRGLEGVLSQRSLSDLTEG